MKNIQDSPSPLPEGLHICQANINGKPDQAETLIKTMADEAGLEGKILTVFKEDTGKPHAHLRNETIGVSISHTRNLMFCGLYLHGEIGLDVESENRNISAGLRSRILHDNETEDMTGLETLRIWTMKEAVLKLTGTGLRTAMKKIEIKKEDAHTFTSQVNNHHITIQSFKQDTYWMSVAWSLKRIS